jgi:hypothetical protein
VQDFFQERDVQEVQRLVANYARDPGNPEILQQVDAMQQGLMAYVAGVGTDRLESLFNGNFGVVFWLLQKSGFSDIPTGKAGLQCKVLDETISRSLIGDGPPDFRALLARILCSPAHRAAVAVAPGLIPAWFRTPYMGYLLVAPEVFLYAGEAELFGDHLLTTARTARPGDERTRRRLRPQG